ncbi:MAG TPA: sugar phosphate isomerase/epimerase family protein, partial [Acidobacteriota bacterium]|nr:sugar phosphate isomerase/epimerase family protein [Acidobacteriota bacterium]
MRLYPGLLILFASSLAFAEDPVLRGGNILACETYSFRDLIGAGKLDLIGVPRFYKEQGIKGISYNDLFFKNFDDAYLDQIVAAVKKADRIVTCYVIEGNLAGADPARRQRQIDLDKQKLRVAHRLGAPIVRINIGATGRQENADDTVGVERVIEAFKELVPLARELNIKISIENHGGVSKTASNIVKIIEATDSKWVGALVDFGNFPPEVRYDEIAKVASHAITTHVKINEFD